MNDRFRNKLSAYKDGELDGIVKDEIFLHLQGCEECRQELAEFERVDSLIKEAPKLELDDSFFLRIMAGISTTRQENPVPVPFVKGVLAKFLQLAGYIFELVSGHEYQKDTLDEFSDFPPLSMSYAYFNVIGQQR